MNIDMGIIGGSGVYTLDQLEQPQRLHVTTPYGGTSGPLIAGSLNGLSVAFIPRHGEGHRIAPANIPARANIYALKSVGARRVISVSAVGSLREDYKPGDLVVPDQIVDRTNGLRPASFFRRGIVVHVPFGDPYCADLRKTLAAAAREATSATVHESGTYCCIEGPQFSTRAESNLYRSWGMDIIGMTALPEAKLAREAEMCYAALALVTDYDCWHAEEESVTASTVAQVMSQNSAHAKLTIMRLAEAAGTGRECDCQSALASSIITPFNAISSVVRSELALFIKKYVQPPQKPLETVDPQPVGPADETAL
ncbi:MAG: S-methyl-5'-thioadenosine phosphorylase [Streptosporangiaceae bacterium]